MATIFLDIRRADGITEQDAGAVARGRRKKTKNMGFTMLCGGTLMLLLGTTFGRPLPDSPAVWFGGALVGLIWANGFEYFYHRFLLHRRGWMHARHHLRHHATARAAGGAEHIALGGSPLRIVALYAINGIPIAATDYLIDLGISLPVIASFTVYLLSLEELHWRLDMSQRLSGWLRFAKDRHETHHDRPAQCFNIFIPLFDRIFGTLCERPSRQENGLAWSGKKIVSEPMEVSMHRLNLITLALILWIGLNPSFAKAQSEIERTWGEMAFVVEREIAISLPDGAYLQGKAVAVSADGLDMDIKKTSQPRLHPKGRATIPRTSITSVELRTKRRSGQSNGAKSVGGAGSVGGFILGGVIGEKFGSLNATFTGMAVGTVVGAIGGVLMGQKLDTEQEILFIRIVPENQDTRTAPASTASGLDDLGRREIGDEPVVDSISPSSPRQIWPR